MHASPRCGARTRRGTACRAPAVKGRPRCRMHGCAPGAGGQIGNRNAEKDGHFTRAAKDDLKLLRELERRWKRAME